MGPGKTKKTLFPNGVVRLLNEMRDVGDEAPAEQQPPTVISILEGSNEDLNRKAALALVEAL